MNIEALLRDLAERLGLVDVGPWQLGAALAAGAAFLFLLALLSVWRRLRAVRRERDAVLPLREDLAEVREALAAARVDVQRLPKLENDLEQARAAHSDEQARRIALERQLESQAETHAARLEELRNMKKELEDRFQNLASGVLKTNSDSFLRLVSERFEKHSQGAREDLEKRQQAIRNLVEPLDRKLTKFDEKIGEIEKARNEAYGAIRAQVLQLAEGQRTLGQETRKLVQALRAPKTRGRWGEMQLKQVFEMAGMAEHVDYVTEHQVETEAGKRRPDAVVRIPGGKTIVVDAKTPLEAYLDALEADTPEAQGVQIRRHAQQVRSHVRTLASKAYQDALDTTPDFVVMFIPGETFVSAAAEADPGLIEYAFDNRVLIATPTTLMALVKAIAYGWQQDKMAENAVEVQRLAKELYDRLGTFAAHLDGVGRSLNSSVEQYNKAVGSLEGRVLPSARRFETLGVTPAGASLDAPRTVASDTRRVTSPEYDP